MATTTNLNTPNYRPMLRYGMLDRLVPGESVLLDMRYYGSLSPVFSWRKIRYGKTFGRKIEGNGVRVWRLS
jgi:hypothetical protein